MTKPAAAYDPPPALRDNVTAVWGDAGRRWLARLPQTIPAVADAWQLEIGDPYPLSYHWVAPVRRADATTAVLKLGVHESTHLAYEATALERFAGRGVVRLLARDAERGASLIEHASPGTMLRELVPDDDEYATAAVVGLLNQLHVASPADVELPGAALPDVESYAESFRDHLATPVRTRLLPREPVERAMRMFIDLCRSSSRRVLLHGDLHHDNVLRAERQPWLAIDPHGVVGDPGFEIAALLYNPDPHVRDETVLGLLPSRLEQLADGLGMTLDVAVAWSYVGCVLSEVWDAESGTWCGGKAWDIARTLRPRLPAAYR